VVALTVLGRGVEPGGDGLASVIPPDSPAIQAELRSIQEFGFPLTSRTVVVQRDPGGLSLFTQAEAVLDAVAANQSPQPRPLLGALPLTNTVRVSGFESETNTTVLTYLFMNPRSSFARQQAAAERYVAENLERQEDHVVGVAGTVPARAEQARLVTENLSRLELLTVLAIFVLVGLSFQSLVAPFLALGCAGLAFVATVQVSTILGRLVGVAAPAELEPLLVALLLGVVTDYTIFYLSALESRVARGLDTADAVAGAVAAFTPIVVAAGLTVAAGTAALLAADSAFFRGFGPAMALAVLVGLAVSVTLVPALLAILGRLAFWPRRLAGPTAFPVSAPSFVDAVARRWRRLRVIEHLTRRAVAAWVLVACVALLVLASLPLLSMRLEVGFTTSLPRDNPVSRATSAASAGFAPGINSPTTLLLEGHGVTARLDELAAFQARIASQPGVAGVLGPAQNIAQRELDIVLASSGGAARMLVVFDQDPLGASSIGDLSKLRTRLPELAERSGLGDVRVSIAGDTALAEGLVRSTRHDLGRIAVAAVAVNLLLLVVFLRALVAPLYLLASSILTLAASLGITVWLFQGVLGEEGLTFYVPFAAAVLLVALGSDYNIFAVGHIWEEAGEQPLISAVRKAAPASARAIFAAGVTLALSFGMLAVMPLRPFRELAFAMCLGILVDVLLVRSVMVPCLLTVVGEASGWPGPHLRRQTAAGRDTLSGHGPSRPETSRARSEALRRGTSTDER
jgi:RND superfamily putative drug exporter